MITDKSLKFLCVCCICNFPVELWGQPKAPLDQDQLVRGDIWLPAVAVLKWVMQKTPAIRNKVITGWIESRGDFWKKLQSWLLNVLKCAFVPIPLQLSSTSNQIWQQMKVVKVPIPTLRQQLQSRGKFQTSDSCKMKRKELVIILAVVLCSSHLASQPVCSSGLTN